MSSSIHIANAKGRDATVGLVPIKAASGPKLGLPGQKLYFRRYLAATECTHQALTKQFGIDVFDHRTYLIHGVFDRLITQA